MWFVTNECEAGKPHRYCCTDRSQTLDNVQDNKYSQFGKGVEPDVVPGEVRIVSVVIPATGTPQSYSRFLDEMELRRKLKSTQKVVDLEIYV